MKRKINSTLIQFGVDALQDFKMSNMLGGEPQGQCSCGCHHANNGGSSECDNSSANFKLGLHSVGGGGSCTSNDYEEHQMYNCA